MLGSFARFLCPDDFFYKINFFQKLFREYQQRVKQFGSRSSPIEYLAWCGSKLFDTLLLFLKDIFSKKKMILKKKSAVDKKHKKLRRMQRVKLTFEKLNQMGKMYMY